MVGKKLKLRKPVEGKDNAPKTEQKMETVTTPIIDVDAPTKETPLVPQDPAPVISDKPADDVGTPADPSVSAQETPGKNPYSDSCPSNLLSVRGGCMAPQGCMHPDCACEAKKPFELEPPEVQARAAVVPVHMISGTPGQKIIIGNPNAAYTPAPYTYPQQAGNLAKTGHITSDPNGVKRGN